MSTQYIVFENIIQEINDSVTKVIRCVTHYRSLILLNANQSFNRETYGKAILSGDQCELNDWIGRLKNCNLRVGFAVQSFPLLPILDVCKRRSPLFRPSSLIARMRYSRRSSFACYRRRSRVIAWAFIAHVALIISKHLARVNRRANFATNTPDYLTLSLSVSFICNIYI